MRYIQRHRAATDNPTGYISQGVFFHNCGNPGLGYIHVMGVLETTSMGRSVVQGTFFVVITLHFWVIPLSAGKVERNMPRRPRFDNEGIFGTEEARIRITPRVPTTRVGGGPTSESKPSFILNAYASLQCRAPHVDIPLSFNFSQAEKKQICADLIVLSR